MTTNVVTDKCPKCKSSEIEGGSFNADTGYAYQEMNCLECCHEWRDVYLLHAQIARAKP